MNQVKLAEFCALIREATVSSSSGCGVENDKTNNKWI
jgi:hypothetical protein